MSVTLTSSSIAGSDTTATALTAVTWFLCSQPSLLSKLQQEVRSAFKSYAEIDALSASRLPYLHAVCLEALRLYPPVPTGMPRLVSDGGSHIDGYFVPGGVSSTLS